jgi:hypothetical protein
VTRRTKQLYIQFDLFCFCEFGSSCASSLVTISDANTIPDGKTIHGEHAQAHSVLRCQPCCLLCTAIPLCLGHTTAAVVVVHACAVLFTECNGHHVHLASVSAVCERPGQALPGYNLWFQLAGLCSRCTVHSRHIATVHGRHMHPFAVDLSRTIIVA